MNTAEFRNTLRLSLTAGVQKGWTGFVWMLKILVPISFLSMLLEYSGVLYRLNAVLEPAMGILSLPPMAALPLVIGIVTNIYGGIAAMVMLPLTMEQMTLIAIFLLISHNMIQEGIIQAKSGIHPIKATVIRLVASVVTVMVSARFMDTGSVSATAAQLTAAAPSTLPFTTVLGQWALAMLYLSLKIFLIIMVLMIVLSAMKNFHLLGWLIRLLSPVLRTLGLNQRVGTLWLTAAAFGIAYGAAVILEEVREGNLTKDELERLHMSIGINHSMIEDPALFMVLGISAFWLWVPRLITAIVAVHLFGLWIRWRNRRAEQAG
ncbi:iron transporter [Desulfatitalea alkaliphila]|uniref:Iron transporter n=1 Tax=Desulfatitalea alkaliphila TaxID=2929485 RepID=A0AA41UP66_9BACT|nr:iron transporter [Desulfatitalea alkaliphila]MCJ8500188.1 iron transporter [Desulfatitalea alkaliphila]